MVNFPIRILNYDSHCPGFFDLFISCDARICCTIAFPPLWNSDHVVLSVSTDFPANSKWDALFHCIAYDYSPADWDGLRDHLRHVPWEDILNSVLINLNFKKKLYGPFLWMGLNCLKATARWAVRGGSLLFTIQFPEILKASDLW